MKRRIMILLLCCALAACSAADKDVSAEAASGGGAGDTPAPAEPQGEKYRFNFSLYHCDDDQGPEDGHHGSWHATVEREATTGSNNATLVDGRTAVVDISIITELCDDDGIVMGDLTAWTWNWEVNHDHNRTSIMFPQYDHAPVNIPDDELSATVTALNSTTLEISWDGFSYSDLTSSQQLCLYLYCRR